MYKHVCIFTASVDTHAMNSPKCTACEWANRRSLCFPQSCESSLPLFCIELGSGPRYQTRPVLGSCRGQCQLSGFHHCWGPGLCCSYLHCSSGVQFPSLRRLFLSQAMEREGCFQTWHWRRGSASVGHGQMSGRPLLDILGTCAGSCHGTVAPQ